MDRLSLGNLVVKMKVKLHCTDKDQIVEADLMNHHKKVFLEVALNTVKLRLNYNGKVYAGSMAGLEFVAQEKDIPEEYRYQEFRRRK